MAAPFSVFNSTSNVDPGAPMANFLPVSGAVTVYSDHWSGEDADGYGLTVFTTGTLNGTFTLWMTDKPLPALADDTDWVQDTSFAPVNPAGAPVKFRDDGGNAKAAKKRLKFVNGAGAGNIIGFATVPRTR